MKVFHIDLMSNLDITKANGPDDISARMLKETALSITSTPIMTHLFNISITLGELPDEWKMARVSHIPKSANHSDPGNYRPISLLSLLSKLLEKHIQHLLATHLEENHPISAQQWGFTRGKSTTGALLDVTERSTAEADIAMWSIQLLKVMVLLQLTCSNRSSTLSPVTVF